MRAASLWLGFAAVTTVLSAAVLAGDNPIAEKDLRKSQTNLKEIGLAFHAHSDKHVRLPSDIYDKEGKPLLSWRVAILPFVEEGELYRQFKLDEAWDSHHNKKLIEKMPKVYAPVRVKAKRGETFYQTFAGKDALFTPKVMYKINTVPDGTSNTAAVFEAAEPVIWSKPAHLPFDEKKPLPKLGGLFDGQCHVLRLDGSVFLMRKDPDETNLKRLIMPADGHPVDFSKLEK